MPDAQKPPISQAELDAALKYIIDNKSPYSGYWASPVILGANVVPPENAKWDDPAEYGAALLNELMRQHKIRLKPGAMPIISSRSFSIDLSLTLSSSEKVRLFRERQKELGRKRLELWVTPLEEAELRKHLQEYRAREEPTR